MYFIIYYVCIIIHTYHSVHSVHLMLLLINMKIPMDVFDFFYITQRNIT